MQEKGQVALSGGGVWVPGTHAPVGGGGRVRVGVHDKVSLEATGQGLQQTFAMGGLGVRYTPYDPKEKKIRAAFDIDVGLAAGAGGRLCTDSGDAVRICDGLDPLKRPAGGGWLGGGVAGHFYFFSLFARVRMQVTTAVNIAPTFWWQVQGGFQFDIVKRAYLYFSSGGFGYVHGNEHYRSWIPVEGGIGLRFGPGSRPRPRAAAGTQQGTLVKGTL